MDAVLWALLTSWHWRLDALLVLGLLGGTYIAGWRRLRQRGSPRNAAGRHLAFYLMGLGLIGLALVSPIDTFTSFLFFMHMIQHVLLAMLAPPLLWLANPFPVMLWGLPRTLRHRIGCLLTPHARLRQGLGVLTLLPVAGLIYVVSLWAWHHPIAYQAALQHDLLHDVEHLMFFVTGMLFWWPIINPAPRLHGHIAHGWRILYVFLAAGQNTLLAAVLALTGNVLYPYYLDVPRLWRLTPMNDQVIGGAIMWLSGGMMYVVTTLLLVTNLLSDKKQQTQPHQDRAQQYEHSGSQRTFQVEQLGLTNTEAASQGARVSDEHAPRTECDTEGAAAGKPTSLKIHNRKLADGADVIGVWQGDWVTLQWHTDEVVIIYLHGYEIEKTVTPETSTVFTFEAHTPWAVSYYPAREGTR